MGLPEFNSHGDLPEGLHKATLAEVLERFGRGSEARQEATAVLQRIHRLVTATRKLERFIVFGSYITAKPAPHDVDVVLVMKDDFSLAACDEQTRALRSSTGGRGDRGQHFLALPECPPSRAPGGLSPGLGDETGLDLSRNC
jgi:hypothetical protein